MVKMQMWWTAFACMDELLTAKNPAVKRHNTDWHSAEQGQGSLRFSNVMMSLDNKEVGKEKYWRKNFGAGGDF